MGYNFHPGALRRGLSAYRLRNIRQGRTRGPVFLLELAEEANRRMSTRLRGRPTAAEWTLRRKIPLRAEHWQDLRRFAASIGVDPAHVAALLIERGLERLRTEPQMGTSLPPPRRPLAGSAGGDRRGGRSAGLPRGTCGVGLQRAPGNGKREQRSLFSATTLLPEEKRRRLERTWAWAFRTKALPLIDERAFQHLFA